MDGQPVQVIAPDLVLPLPVVDLQDSQRANARQLYGAWHEEAQRPFDLAQGPLVRATLLRLSG